MQQEAGNPNQRRDFPLFEWYRGSCGPMTRGEGVPESGDTGKSPRVADGVVTKRPLSAQ